MNRRKFLKLSSATVTATATMASLNSMLAHATQVGSNNDDYKALVCVFLYGGMDSYDTVIPSDPASYQEWATIRQSLLNGYATPRGIDNLLPLQTPARFGGRTFALPPEMPGLQALYQQGNMAVVGNVGPLLEPTTKTAVFDETANLPARLFSHNDQQSTWMSGSTEGAQYGWAGQLHDALLSNGHSNNSPFSAVTMSSAELMITGQQTVPYHLIGGQALNANILDNVPNELRTDLTNHFSHSTSNSSNLLNQDIAQKHAAAFESNALFQQAVGQNSDAVPSYGQSYLGSQLFSVANVVKANEQLGANRQVFVVTLGGFDTHSEQATELPELQAILDSAISGFYNDLEQAGLHDKVTLFTASDFGRTLAINGDGTDHGWGAHHFVVGGAVDGGTIYGDVPPANFNHSLDVGSGRLLPTMSIEQYAANFASWMGLSESQIESLFPELLNFAERPNFMS